MSVQLFVWSVHILAPPPPHLTPHLLHSQYAIFPPGLNKKERIFLSHQIGLRSQYFRQSRQDVSFKDNTLQSGVFDNPKYFS